MYLMNKRISQVDAGKVADVFRKESEAIDYAIRNAKKGSFIIICSDVVPDALDQIMRLKEADDLVETQPVVS